MTNIFSLILGIVTLITGMFWIVRYFKFTQIKYHFFMKNYKPCSHMETIQNKNNIVNMINKKKKLLDTVASIFPILLLIFMIRSFLFEPFYIPSGSMMPTLLIGDFILVEKFSYGIKNPFTQKTLIETGHPKRGDVVVFQYPFHPSLNYIKRVIGLPGDRISYNPINKQIMIRHNHASLLITYSELTQSNFIQTFNSIDNKILESQSLQDSPDNKFKKSIRMTQCTESLNGVTHNILLVPEQKDQLEFYYHQPNSALAEWIVPQGEYFMMGDNRDNSADSRYWGFVPEKNLVGKARVVFMSVYKKEGKWPMSLRLSHIGNIH